MRVKKEHKERKKGPPIETNKREYREAVKARREVRSLRPTIPAERMSALSSEQTLRAATNT
jgi:hypothetical protein